MSYRHNFLVNVEMTTKKISCSAESSMKFFITLGPRICFIANVSEFIGWQIDEYDQY